jgi:hypothetical protein
MEGNGIGNGLLSQYGKLEVKNVKLLRPFDKFRDRNDRVVDNVFNESLPTSNF